MLHFSIAADQTSKSPIIFMLGKLPMPKKIKKGGYVLPKIFTSEKNNLNAIISTQKNQKLPYSCIKSIRVSNSFPEKSIINNSVN